mgnify:CR=1 FL=1
MKIISGALASPPDKRDYPACTAYEDNCLSLPDRFEVWQPPTENQYCTQNCVAQTVANIFECHRHRLLEDHKDYSVGYIYGSKNHTLEGMYLREACKIAVDIGDVYKEKFESNEERRQKVNLTMWDYCNRIKTFSNKYLFEIYSAESIPLIIHGDNAEEFESFEPIVFVYNNLELIIAKIKTTDENGEVVKRRLNIRSALRKLNEFKQGMENAV